MGTTNPTAPVDPNGIYIEMNNMGGDSFNEEDVESEQRFADTKRNKLEDETRSAVQRKTIVNEKKNMNKPPRPTTKITE
jgi:hypothetical protein